MNAQPVTANATTTPRTPATARWQGLAGSLGALGAGAACAVPLDVLVVDALGAPRAAAVVYLESAAARAASRPLAGYEITQKERQFQPQVNVVTLGSVVRFPNHDTVRHHVYSFSPTKAFELKLYAGQEANPVTFDQPGLAVLGCNIHDAMVAWVLVVETPHHAITGADGRARLDAPAGSYRLRAWHNSLPAGTPPSDQALAVAASGASTGVRLPAR